MQEVFDFLDDLEPQKRPDLLQLTIHDLPIWQPIDIFHIFSLWFWPCLDVLLMYAAQGQENWLFQPETHRCHLSVAFAIVDVKVVGLLLLYSALTHGSDSDIWKAQVLGDNISDAVLHPLLVLCCIPWWHVRSNTVQWINWTPYMEHVRCCFVLVA